MFREEFGPSTLLYQPAVYGNTQMALREERISGAPLGPFRRVSGKFVIGSCQTQFGLCYPLYTGYHTIATLDCGTLCDSRPQRCPLPRCEMACSVWKCTSQEALRGYKWCSDVRTQTLSLGRQSTRTLAHRRSDLISSGTSLRLAYRMLSSTTGTQLVQSAGILLHFSLSWSNWLALCFTSQPEGHPLNIYVLVVSMCTTCLITQEMKRPQNKARFRRSLFYFPYTLHFWTRPVTTLDRHALPDTTRVSDRCTAERKRADLKSVFL